MTNPTGDPPAPPRTPAAAPGAPAVELPDAEAAARIAAVEAMTPKQVPLRLGRAVVFSFGLASVGAVVWAGISYGSGLELGIIAIAVGYLAGLGAIQGGRGRAVQIVGAAAGAFGFFLGQSFFVLLVNSANDKVVAAFSLHPAHILSLALGVIVQRTFSSLDMVFLAICVWEGWKIPRAR